MQFILTGCEVKEKKLIFFQKSHFVLKNIVPLQVFKIYVNKLEKTRNYVATRARIGKRTVLQRSH